MKIRKGSTAKRDKKQLIMNQMGGVQTIDAEAAALGKQKHLYANGQAMSPSKGGNQIVAQLMLGQPLENMGLDVDIYAGHEQAQRRAGGPDGTPSSKMSDDVRYQKYKQLEIERRQQYNNLLMRRGAKPNGGHDPNFPSYTQFRMHHSSMLKK